MPRATFPTHLEHTTTGVQGKPAPQASFWEKKCVPRRASKWFAEGMRNIRQLHLTSANRFWRTLFDRNAYF
jgi:hypothetical protein